MKGTPKSCSCPNCRKGKSNVYGKTVIKNAQKSYRKKTKEMLLRGSGDEDIILPAPYAAYTD